MQEEHLSEKESLELKTGMITKAKNHYHESGARALLWGFGNVVCFTLAYMTDAIKGFNFPFNPFFLLIGVAILQIYFHRRERKHKTTVTYKDEAHTIVWTAFGISVLILTIAGGFADTGYVVLPLLLLLFAIPTFISGSIKKFKPLITGGIICWILSAVCFFYQQEESLLIVALGATFAWIIPGFILRKNFYKKAGN